jgi:hypothetical protein
MEDEAQSRRRVPGQWFVMPPGDAGEVAILVPWPDGGSRRPALISPPVERQTNSGVEELITSSSVWRAPKGGARDSSSWGQPLEQPGTKRGRRLVWCNWQD